MLFFWRGSSKKDTEYRIAVKEYFLQEVLEKYYTDVTFNPGSGIPAEQINRGKIIDVGKYFSSNDYMQATYKGIFIQQSDISISVRTSDKKKEVFKGQWIIANLPKNIDGFLRIYEKKNKRNIALLNDRDIGKIKHISLENEEFNSTFMVEGTNDIEGYYFLTPHLMEKIIKINENTLNGAIIAYYNQQLHIGLNSMLDLYEPNYREPLTLSYFNKIENEITRVTAILDEFI